MRKKYREILKNVKYIKGWIALAMALGVIMHSLYLMSPKLAESIIAVVETTQDMSEFYRYVIIFLIVIILSVVFDRIYMIVKRYSKASLYVIKAKHYREVYMQMDYNQILDLGTGKAIARIERGISAEVNIFMRIFDIVLNVFFRGTALMILISMQEWRLSIVLGFAFIVVFAFNHFFYKKLKPIVEKLNNLDEDVTRNIVRIVMEHLLIKVSNKKKSELKKSAILLDQYPRLEVKSEFYQYSFFDILHLMIKVIELAIYVYVGLLIMKEGALISYLILLTGYLWMLWTPIERAVTSLATINEEIVYYDKLQNFINQEQKIINGKRQLKFKAGSIEIKNMSFAYNYHKNTSEDASDNIFSEFSLKFEPGKTTALVGHSGSGKSTLMKLLLRLYDPQTGGIFVDGEELKKLHIESFYQHVGYLSQEPAIFDGTIRENLGYALLDDSDGVDDQILRNALKKAQAFGFVDKLKDKLETEIGEKGMKLSGGEKQRLAIARIFLKNPEILILDEPTSSLDSISESKITKVLKNMMKNRTVIVIAHRLQTVQHADKIVVLENGNIVETGKHDELVKTKGIYSTLVDLQHGTIVE